MGRSESSVHRNELVELLTAALGKDVAATLVVNAAAELGLSTFEFTADEAHQVLVRLSEEDGLVGITARLAKSRLMRLVKDR